MFDPRDLSVLLRSGAALVVVETHEESLLLDSFKHVMAELMRPLWRWSITNGLQRLAIVHQGRSRLPARKFSLLSMFRLFQMP